MSKDLLNDNGDDEVYSDGNMQQGEDLELTDQLKSRGQLY